MEGAGIIMIAGRVSDLVAEARRLPSEVSGHVREGEARLRAYLWRPAQPFPRWLQRPKVHSVQVATRAHGVASIQAVKILGGPLPDRIRRVHEDLRELAVKVEHLESGLPGRIREGAKDPWVGLLLLFLGLGFLLAASIMGAFL